MSEIISTNILVPGRGHDILADGTLQLSVPTIQRVDTAVKYFSDNYTAFEQANGLIVMSGGYATLATGNKIKSPPHELREGSLMAALAISEAEDLPDIDIGPHIRNVSSPTTTMECLLRTNEEGLFGNITPDNPLGIVTQESQWERLEWFARKVFKLPKEAVTLIQAPGEDDQAILKDERKLLKMAKIVYGSANTARGLRRAERFAEMGSAILTKLGLQEPPANKYLDFEKS